MVAATLGTNNKAGNARGALADVCQQSAAARDIVLCNWDAASSWGVQVADYGLWAAQRELEGRSCKWWPQVQPLVHSVFKPWGQPR